MRPMIAATRAASHFDRSTYAHAEKRRYRFRMAMSFGATVLLHAIGVHVYTLGSRASRPELVPVDRTSQLVFIMLQETGESAPVVQHNRRSSQSYPVSAKTPVVADGRGSDEVAKTVPTAPISAIDWYVEKDQAVGKVMEELAATRRIRTFSGADRVVSIPLPRTVEHDDFPWDPLHGKRAGLTDEGLLFVKLSKNCMIVTVFLVCQFGGDIVPRGDLFEDLDVKLDRIRERELP